MTEPASDSILNGIRVIEWSQYYAAPGAAALLGDMGADVIVLERADGLSPTRQMRKIGNTDFGVGDDRSALVEAVERNKRSVTVDINSSDGGDVVRDLVRNSDVFLTNFRGPTIERTGMSYGELNQVNPRLIYSKVSGFGPTGPFKDRGGFDFLVQGYSGILHRLGGADDDTDISPPADLIVDHLASIFTAYSVVAALYYRQNTGLGQELHTSLLGTALNAFQPDVLLALLKDQTFTKHSRREPGSALRNYYRCADGKWLISANNPPGRYWPTVAEMLDVPVDLIDPANDGLRAVEVLDQIFARRSRDEWLARASQFDLIFAPVNTFAEAVQEEQVKENYITEFDHASLGKLPFPGFVTHFSRSPVRPRRSAPEQGAHTDEVLGEICGYSADRIADLRRSGAIG